jgi:hypothetical protein
MIKKMILPSDKIRLMTLTYNSNMNIALINQNRFQILGKMEIIMIKRVTRKIRMQMPKIILLSTRSLQMILIKMVMSNL